MIIGFIGLGIMGESMAENIIKKHDDLVYVYDIVDSQVEKLVQLGAKNGQNNVELAKNSDVIISMVPKSEHVLGVFEEIKDHLEGKIWIDMSTIDPKTSVDIYKKVKNLGGSFVDAPVVKSKPAAIAGKLGIYVGCEESLYETVKPILSYMGENIIRMGENGKGLVMKICHNSLVSEIQNGVNELLVMASKYGVSIEDFKTAASYGGAQNFYLDGQWEKLLKEDYSTAFSMNNMHKDLGIALGMMEEANLDLPGLKNAKKVYDKGLEEGLGQMDFRTTYKVVKENK